MNQKSNRYFIRLALLFLWAISIVKLFTLPENPVLICLLLLAGMLLSVGEDGEQKKKADRWLIVYAVFISVSVVVGSKLETGRFLADYSPEAVTYSGLWTNVYVKGLAVSDFFYAVFLLLGNVIVLDGLQKKCGQWSQRVKLEVRTAGRRKAGIAASLTIFVAWLPYLLTFYPGFIFGDSLSSIYQSLGLMPYSNNHPICYTLFVQLFIRLGQFLGSINFGCFLYTLVQMIIISASFGYGVSFLWKKGISDRLLVLVTLFYALVPVFPLHAMSMWKDPLFSTALFLMMLWLFDFVESKGALVQDKWEILHFILIGLAVCLLRNNGFYVMVLIVFVLCLAYGIRVRDKRLKVKGFVYPFVGMLAGVYILTGPIYSALGLNGKFTSLAIPMQQMAAVIVSDGDMTAEDEEFLYHLLPKEEYINSYTPCCLDNLTWRDDFNNEYLTEHKAQLKKTYLGMMRRNFKTYVKAYLLQTYGFWSMNDWENNFHDYSLTIYQYDENLGLGQHDLLDENFGISLKHVISDQFQFLRSGVLTWMILFCGALFLIGRKKEYLIALLPALGILLTLLLATPLADWLRYALIYVYSIPVIIFFPTLVFGKKKD